MSKQKQEGNKYDKILKENFEVVLRPLLERYLGIRIVTFENIDPKLQTTIEKETDFIRIVTTEEGERFILHIEFQSANEADMIYRIKEYGGIIQRKYKLEIRHFVIYLGPGKMTMRTQLHDNEVFRGFDVLNMNDLNFDDFLSSQIPEEIVFAILCDFRGEQPEHIIRSILEKLKAVSKNPTKLQKFVKQLQVFSHLRKLDNEINKISYDMPILIDIKESAFYKRGAEEGLEKGLEKKARIACINMLKKGMPIKDIAEILEVSIDYVIQIQNELYEKEATETKRADIISMLEKDISIEDIAESQKVSIEEVISIKNELDQQQE